MKKQLPTNVLIFLGLVTVVGLGVFLDYRYAVTESRRERYRCASVNVVELPKKPKTNQ
jgi:hypothetical protein